MCGYCIENVMISFIHREKQLGSINNDAKDFAPVIIQYLQETKFPAQTIQEFIPETYINEALYVIHCKTLEESLLSNTNTFYKILLKYSNFYIQYFKTAFSIQALNTLPIQMAEETYQYVYNPLCVLNLKDKNQSLLNNTYKYCVDLLEYYYNWWLLESGKEKMYSEVMMENKGYYDPIQEVTRDSWKEYKLLFPSVYFSLCYLSRFDECMPLLEKIAYKDTEHVPDFDGLDLWLKRKAISLLLKRYGPTYILNQNRKLSLNHMFYHYIFNTDLQNIKHEVIKYLKTCKNSSYCSVEEMISDIIEHSSHQNSDHG